VAETLIAEICRKSGVAVAMLVAHDVNPLLPA